MNSAATENNLATVTAVKDDSKSSSLNLPSDASSSASASSTTVVIEDKVTLPSSFLSASSSDSTTTVLAPSVDKPESVKKSGTSSQVKSTPSEPDQKEIPSQQAAAPNASILEEAPDVITNSATHKTGEDDETVLFEVMTIISFGGKQNSLGHICAMRAKSFILGMNDNLSLFQPSSRAKLYCFDNACGEWKERGTGTARLLKHKETKKTRFLMRREKTYKICSNHYIQHFMDLHPNKNNDRSWIWDCPCDFSKDYNTPTAELYAIRFQTIQYALDFKKTWEECQKDVLPLANPQS